MSALKIPSRREIERKFKPYATEIGKVACAWGEAAHKARRPCLEPNRAVLGGRELYSLACASWPVASGWSSIQTGDGSVPQESGEASDSDMT
jgi:hypothetical protein